MARYLLDTNILAFLMLGDDSNLSTETLDILSDTSNVFCVSSVSVTEILQLYRIKKIRPKQFKTIQELYRAIEDSFFITILPFTKQHTAVLSNLRVVEGHNDPFDHSILAQAITEKMPLISSDHQFKNYTSQKLDFIFNKR